MRHAFFFVTSVFAPCVFMASAMASGLVWMLWASVAFATLIILVVAARRLRKNRPTWPLLPVALLLVTVVVTGIASPGATTWILAPLLVAVMAAAALAFADRFKRRLPRERGPRAAST